MNVFVDGDRVLLSWESPRQGRLVLEPLEAIEHARNLFVEASQAKIEEDDSEEGRIDALCCLGLFNWPSMLISWQEGFIFSAALHEAACRAVLAEYPTERFSTSTVTHRGTAFERVDDVLLSIADEPLMVRIVE